MTQEQQLERAKSLFISEKKNLANKTLRTTDWYVIRKMETGVEIPQDILDKRAAIKSEVETYETNMNAATTIEEAVEKR